MNNYWAFAPMRDSNELLGDPEALRKRMDEDGYVLIRRLIDPERIAAVRNDFQRILAEKGWIHGGDRIDERAPARAPLRESDDEYFTAYDEIQKLESFHTLAHDEQLIGLMRHLLGTTAWPHPLKVARLVFPGAPEVSTPPHQDFLNNQGTPELTATWIPLHDCPMEQGSLAVLRGSHKHGVLPLEWHLGPGNRQAKMPPEIQEELRWVTTDVDAGDVLIFGALTVHAALNNATFGMRLSVDFRFQEESREVSELVLEPHFNRLSWEEIYAGWSSDELKYYWRDLEFDVVPYDKTPFEESAPSEEQIIQALVYDDFRQQRFEGQKR
jgi:ectoine hydroxylase-related dioxygenase (phytanoyl-CoA dioxygenase family)